MRTRTLALTGATAAVLLAGAAWWWSSSSTADGGLEARVSTDGASGPKEGIDSAARAPDSVRIRVRVLNGTDITGLARRGMQVLRDHGYDVVDYASAPPTFDSTLIEADARFAPYTDRLQRALGGVGLVRETTTPSPHVDVTVTLGTDWKPPAKPFRP